MLHIKEDVRVSLNIMSDLLNEPQDIIIKSKRPIFAFSRAIIAEQLLKLGYTKGTIGKALQKDHSTIVQCLRRLDSILTVPGYDDIRELRNKFISIIHEPNKKLKGIVPDTCIWNVSVKDRLCNYCKVTNCVDRKI